MKSKVVTKCVKKGANTISAHIKKEISKGFCILGRAIRDALANLISQAIVQFGMDMLQSLIMNHVVDPLVRKIDKLCKKLGWNTSEFLAA